MEEQTEVTLRCRECRRLRPGDTPTAIGRLLRTPEGHWQAYRMERSPVPLKPICLDGSWMLGDPRYVIAGNDRGYLPSLLNRRVMISKHARTIELPCPSCIRAPARVRAPRIGGRALAQGLAEVDV
jgi:hypothetical protein